MEQYIPKSAVAAEIERIEAEAVCEYNSNKSRYAEGSLDVLHRVKHFLSTFEVEEVDLKDSIKETLAQKYINYTSKRHNIDPESKEGQLIYYAYMHGMNQCLNQLKTQKGE